ncbi:MAG: gfo/Idh/MocA family oxidoreductase [Phycisphaera sp.]|nr:gfo/Idh/MocA family oxidoreductase [Phycisphaera sp.]
MGRFRVAIIGAGFIGPVHCEGLRRAGQDVIGIVGVDEAESKKAAGALGIAKAYKTVDELLADGEVQSVHIATPNRFHYGQVKAAINAGKHVMCEKPLAMNSTETAELVKLAAGSGVVAGVNYNIRKYPLCIEAAERMKSGEIGDLLHVNGSYVQDWLFKDTDFNWRVLAKEGGELRAVADIGTHWLDLIHAITGAEIEAVCADLQTVYPIRNAPTGEVETYSGKTNKVIPTRQVEIDTEDAGVIMLKFKGGARGSIRVSQTTAGRKNRLCYELAGSKAALAWDSESPNVMWIGHRDRPNEMLVRDPSQLSDAAAAASNYPGGHNEGFPDTFKQNFKAFYGYIAAGDFKAPRPFATFEDGHREVVLCEAILKSHRDQAWVTVGS